MLAILLDYRRGAEKSSKLKVVTSAKGVYLLPNPWISSSRPQWLLMMPFRDQKLLVPSSILRVWYFHRFCSEYDKVDTS